MHQNRFPRPRRRRNFIRQINDTHHHIPTLNPPILQPILPTSPPLHPPQIPHNNFLNPIPPHPHIAQPQITLIRPSTSYIEPFLMPPNHFQLLPRRLFPNQPIIQMPPPSAHRSSQNIKLQRRPPLQPASVSLHRNQIPFISLHPKIQLLSLLIRHPTLHHRPKPKPLSINNHHQPISPLHLNHHPPPLISRHRPIMQPNRKLPLPNLHRRHRQFLN
jgi:hypothetical protein